MMDANKIQSYQPGGDVYQGIVTKYGQGIADLAASAASSGDETQINAVLAGKKLDDSFWDNLGTQLYNEPFTAPIEQAQKIFSNTGKAFKNAIFGNLSNPLLWAFVIIAGLVLFAWLGGFRLIRGILGK